MPAKRSLGTFGKISGFKVLAKCRGCGKKFESEKYHRYCKECANKIKKK